MKLRRMIGEFRPDVLMGWAGRGSRMLPRRADCIRIARLGDYPLTLKYFHNVDVLVGNTPGIVERCRELGWKRRSEVISNFTHFRPVPPVDRARLATPESAFVIVGVGRFVPRKGFDCLIEAAAKVAGAYVWLVGDGQERTNLQEQAARLGIADRVRFAGWQTDPGPYLAAADVSCMPSSHEPLGNVILEAWASGRPVVAARSEGPMWMMHDGQDGLMFDIGDAAGLAAALMRLRDETGLGERMVAGGQATLAERFSVDAITDAYLGLFGARARDADSAHMSR
jgi:glycosyltransferase involved in cell wall biosynthesis